MKKPLFRTPEEHVPENKHVLDARETYLFSNCARHADTFGVILGVPLACITTLLFRQRTRVGRLMNPFVASGLVGVPTAVVTYVLASCTYSDRVCWGYLKLLPEESMFRELSLREEIRTRESLLPFARTRALIRVMQTKASLDLNPDLSEHEKLNADEKHAIQSALRPIANKEHNIPTRIRNYVAGTRWGEHFESVDKVMWRDGARREERIVSAHRPMEPVNKQS